MASYFAYAVIEYRYYLVLLPLPEFGELRENIGPFAKREEALAFYAKHRVTPYADLVSKRRRYFLEGDLMERLAPLSEEQLVKPSRAGIGLHEVVHRLSDVQLIHEVDDTPAPDRG